MGDSSLGHSTARGSGSLGLGPGVSPAPDGSNDTPRGGPTMARQSGSVGGLLGRGTSPGPDALSNDTPGGSGGEALRKRLALMVQDDTRSMTRRSLLEDASLQSVNVKPRSMSTAAASPPVDRRVSASTRAGRGCCGFDVDSKDAGSTAKFCAQICTLLSSHAGMLLQTAVTVFLPLMVVVVIIGILLATKLDETHEANGVHNNLQFVSLLHAYMFENAHELVWLYAQCLAASTVTSGHRLLPPFATLAKQAGVVDASLLQLQQYRADHPESGNVDDDAPRQPTYYLASDHFTQTLEWMNWQQQQRTKLINSTSGWDLSGLAESMPTTLDATLLTALTASTFDLSSTLSPSSSFSALSSSVRFSSALPPLVLPLLRSYTLVHANLLATVRNVLQDTQIRAGHSDSSHIVEYAESIESEEFMWMQFVNQSEQATCKRHMNAGRLYRVCCSFALSMSDATLRIQSVSPELLFFLLTAIRTLSLPPRFVAFVRRRVTRAPTNVGPWRCEESRRV
jgi:hypothetical protein